MQPGEGLRSCRRRGWGPGGGGRGWGEAGREEGHGGGGGASMIRAPSQVSPVCFYLCLDACFSSAELKRGISQDLTSSPESDRYKIARQLTEKAIKEKKIFSIYGHYPVIRAALRRKGWVEKKFHFLPKVLLNVDDDGAEENQEAAPEKTDDIHDGMSRLVKNEMPYFLWTIKRDVVDCHSLNCDQMLNHYGKTASFTTKIGLCANMRNLPWYVQADPDSFFPRCYGLCTENEKQEFLDDFRRTMASSILKWVVRHHKCGSRGGGGPWPRQQERCVGPEAAPWGENSAGGAAGRASRTGSSLPAEEGAVLGLGAEPRPRVPCPRAERGPLADIVCMNRVEDILQLVTADHPSAKDNKWVVQKYIETPLLIYDTKFDIRQWFLVTDWNPLTIWFYKESYLRFSTQRFSLDNLDSAIHLCNNSIQKHLKNDEERSPLLPYHNMWTSTRFREYLQKRGRGAVWASVIYPAMKRAVADTMRGVQDHVEPRKNSFELYGADFILGRDFQPWLIEINSSPTMHASTPVTAQLCAQVQEDTIKVVVGRKVDRNCDVGNFELLWRQPAVEPPPFHGSDLCVEGVGVRRARKQMPPVSGADCPSALLDPPPLKVRSPSAVPGLAPGRPPTAVRGDLRPDDAQAPACTLPAPLKRPAERRCEAQSARKSAVPTRDFQLADGQSDRRSGADTVSARARPAVLPSVKSPEGALFQPLTPPGSAAGAPTPRASGVEVFAGPCSQGCREESLLVSSSSCWLLVMLGAPWLVLGPLQAAPRPDVVFLLCVSVSKVRSWKDTAVGLGPTPSLQGAILT
uniref:Tubulin tyrosine ligase like 8 n=1 Tax=Lynx canadensis TaxID=61383 RepID=A0A667FUT8_LYNCA